LSNLAAGRGGEPDLSRGVKLEALRTHLTLSDAPERKRLKPLGSRVKAPQIAGILLNEPDPSLGIDGRGHNPAFSLWGFPGVHLTR